MGHSDKALGLFAEQAEMMKASFGLDAAKAGKAVVVAGVPNKVWSRVARSMPRTAMRELARMTTSQRGR